MDKVNSLWKSATAGLETEAEPEQKGYEAIKLEDIKDGAPLLKPEQTTSPNPNKPEGDNEDEDEDDGLEDELNDILPPAPAKPAISAFAFWFWIFVNCAATLAIVLVNKIILANPTLKGAPQLFVAYHFALTGLTLYGASLIGAFEPKAAPILGVLPLAATFAAHTVITNWSLALLEVAIYQELRILVTPATVALNWIMYRKGISWQSMAALVVVCGGIAITVYSDTMHKLALKEAALAGADAATGKVDRLVRLFTRADATDVQTLKNTPIGYLCGLGGVILAALYTIWVGAFLPKFSLSPMQLLTWQAPLGSLLLLISSPFMDTLPVWSNITAYEWTLLVISGLCAVLINVSQFFIVAGSSALSSSVVGHAKTAMVVIFGAITAGGIAFGAGLGILIAMVGIGFYSYLGLQEGKKGGGK